MVNLKNRTVLRSVVAGFLTAVSVVGLGACATGDPGVVHIIGNAIPKNEGGTCVSDEIKSLYDHGVLDLALTDHYVYFAAIESLLDPSILASGNGTKELRPDTSVLTLDTLHVTAVLPGPAPTSKTAKIGTSPLVGTGFDVLNIDPSKFTPALPKANIPLVWTVPTQIVIKSRQSAVFPINLIPTVGALGDAGGTALKDIGADWKRRFANVAGDAKYKQVVPVQMTFFLTGTSVGGSAVKTPPLSFTINVCWFCLLSSPPGYDAKLDTQWRQCVTGGTSAGYVSPCHVGQNEEPVDCSAYCTKCAASLFFDSKCDEKFCPSPL